MCGRYSLIAGADQLALRFDFDAGALHLSPNFNVAPSQSVLTVRAAEGPGAERRNREAALMRWGLIPSWAKDKSIGYKMINARAETVAERPSYRTALQRRRCLVIADGFYEWQRDGKARRPMRITLQSGEPFAFAGLWETWARPRRRAPPVMHHHHHHPQRPSPPHPRPHARNPAPRPRTPLA